MVNLRSDTIRLLFSPSNLVHCTLAILILCGLYLVSLQNYLLFHSIIELATIVIVFAIFVIVWNTRRSITNTFFLVIGISCLFIGGIDLIHMLAYKGMGVFPGNSSDLPTQLWIAARYFQSIAFFIATLLIGKSLTKDRKYDAGIIFAACTAAFVLILTSIFVWQDFPPCFIEGVGLTPFKIASEYVISVIMLATIVLLVHRRRSFDPSVWKFLVAAMVFLIAGELAFTSYISVYGFMNMLGHLLKLVSVYFLYRAIVVVGITRPFDLLFRELKKNEESLRESEKKYRQLIELAHEGVWTIDTEANTTFVNARMAEILGYTAEEMWGRSLFAFMDEHGVALAQANIERRRQGIREQHDFEFIRKDGKRVYTSLETTPLTDEAGVYIGALAVVADITERKQADGALRETKDYLENLIGYANAPIIVWNPRFEITEFNHAFEILTGLSRGEVIGKPLSILFPVESREKSLDLIRQTLAGKWLETVEIPIRHVSGVTHIVLWNSANVLDSRGKVIATIAQGQDITERVQGAEALRNANRQLNLLSSITRHDILNQLTALRGYLELSHDVINDPKTLLGFLEKEEQAAGTIQRQITFTKDYQDLGAAAPAWQNVNTSITKAVAGLPMRAVRVNVDKHDLEIYADPLFLKVFYNLIDNALRYGGEQMTTIRVSSQESDSGLTILCEDDGVGITEEDKKRLFTRGFGKNTGLGLFLSREILAITGITITENGTPGKGARFEITVPKGGYRFTGTG